MTRRRSSSLVPFAASAGVAGLTAAFVMAPGATAAPSTAPSTSAKDKAPASPNTAATKARVPRTDPVQGNFGTQKIRVGVQIKDGAYVPTGTTTAGTTIKIVETGPNADSILVQAQGNECTTSVPNPAAPTTTETICQFGNGANDYLAGPGDTVTFTQETVNKGLVIDSSTNSVGPCVNPNVEGPDSGPPCPGEGQYTHVLFTDPGLPPLAVDDSRTTGPGQPVDIAVLQNDDAKGAPPTVTRDTDPSHGSVTLKSNTFTYTPNDGFAGQDTFDYTLTTANGSSRATVTITVTAAPTSSTPSSPTPSVSPSVTSAPPTSVTPSQPPLANTGTPSSSLVGLGGLLIAFGSMVVLAARRRYGPRHAPR